MKLIELTLGDFDSGIIAISMVDDPAIQSDFLALADSKLLLKIEDEEQRIVTGAILIPDIKILRFDQETQTPYHIFFSAETVSQLSQKYLKDFNQASVNLDHAFNVEGVTLTESWIKIDDTNDKSVALGLDVPVGTWLGTMKVDNDEVWNDWIKAGHLKGFSIEANSLTRTEIQEEDETLIQNNISMTKESLLAEIKSLFLPEKEVELQVEVETVSKEDHIELCGKVDSLTEQLQTIIDAQKAAAVALEVEEVKEEEVTEEVVEAVAEVVEEVIEEPKEEIELIAVTDAVEPSFKKVAFDYKLSREERIQRNIVK